MGIIIDNIVDGIFLFILIGFSNYINRIMPNRLEKFLFSNVWFQHVLIFFLINFSVELVNNGEESPLDNFYNSLVIYLFYILFSKCDVIVCLLLIFILAALFIMTSEKTYQGEDGKYLEKSIRIVSYVAAGIVGLSTVRVIWTGYQNNPNFNPLYFYLNITDNVENVGKTIK